MARYQGASFGRLHRGKLRRSILTSFFALSAWLMLTARPALGDQVLYPAEGISEGRAELAEAAAIHEVTHLSNRRRLTTFFVNEQTPFYGVQLNYVNVGRGNLTFLNRDLVRLGGIPIVVGRVYDSRLAGQGDFGDGWKLSVAETIRRDGGNLRYVDAGGSEHRLELDGARIRSPYPHLTGIRGGRRVGPLVELDVGDLIKRFKPIDNALYLDEVRNREGDYLRLEYSGTRVVRVVSNHGRFVTVERDSSGRIAGLEDDAGRTVRYEYDGAGRLVGVTDAGGRPWRLEYNSRGLLTGVEDPRGSVSLAATHGDDGRVRTVRVLFDAMSFEYQASSTTVRNALQQAATFWQASSGLTTIAQDFAGSITELSLSEQLRPVALTFDGGLVAELEYTNGALQTLTSFVTGAPETTEFVYDSAGRVSSLLTEGESTAEYGYDARGRVVSAADALGHRAYEYAGRAVQHLTINYSGLDLSSNELGLLTGFRNEKQLVRLAYDDRDQLRRIDFSQGGRRSQTLFEYGDEGLRTAASYSLGDEGEAALEFDYDEVGNLTELLGVAPDGHRSGQTYVLGDNNQLSILRNPERPDLVFEYDFAGRPTASIFNDRRKDFRYDNLGRLAALYEDGTQVLQSNYGPMDVDAATEGYGHSAFVAIEAPIASGIFGSLEEIAYARTHGTPFGPIRFSASMARFVLAETLVPTPDSVLLASFHGRSLPISAASHGYEGHATEVVSPTPMGFDKPSNALFLPAEFSSLNCQFCFAYTWGSSPNVTVNGVSSGTALATAGQNSSVNVVNGGYAQCWIEVPGYAGHGYFLHTIDFGDGVATNGLSYSPDTGTGPYPHTYWYPGLYTAQDAIYCSCSSESYAYAQFFGQPQRQVQVLPPPVCSVDFNLTSPNAFDISVTPTMPTINANVTSLNPANASVSWTAQITHTAPAACSGGPTFSSTVNGSGASFSPTFPGFYGGDLSVTATCSAPGYASSSATRTNEIDGLQPSDASIGSEIGTVTSPFDSADLRRVACTESNMTQFVAATGLPLYGGGGDAGIMQICFQRTNGDLWNWRTNIASGRAVLNTSRNSAQNHLNNEVAQGATPYTTQMWREEGIHRYNAGTGAGNEYREWNSVAAVWVIVDRGGVGGYVPAVLGQSATCT